MRPLNFFDCAPRCTGDGFCLTRYLMASDLSNTLVIIPREGMGHGLADLQIRLLKTWLKLLMENNLRPTIAFYTEGVKLLIEGSPVLEELQLLESRGLRLIACKTCLDHWNLASLLRAGIVGGMGDIQAAQVLADKVITL